MKEPKIAGKTPLAVALEAGKRYAWCSCGESSNQPWCDGKHKGSGFSPTVFVAEKDQTGYMCNCKHSSTPQFCDGSHSKI